MAVVGHASGHQRMRELKQDRATPPQQHDSLAVDLPGDSALQARQSTLARISLLLHSDFHNRHRLLWRLAIDRDGLDYLYDLHPARDFGKCGELAVERPALAGA